MYNPFTLKDKVIIVTGASSGIGAKCAVDFSRMGAKVALVGRNLERLNKTLMLCDNPSCHMIVVCDLTDSNVMKDTVKNIVSKLGKINGVVNCAGISSVTPLKMITNELLNVFFQTNVYSAINLSKEAVKVSNCDKENGCSVIFLASIMGCVGEKGKTLYSATKGALISASRSMACELAKNKIRVNVISPGAIITPINANQSYIKDPIERKQLEDKHLLGLGETEDISNACIFLLSDASRWITGQNIIVDGGYTAK